MPVLQRHTDRSAAGKDQSIDVHISARFPALRQSHDSQFLAGYLPLSLVFISTLLLSWHSRSPQTDLVAERNDDFAVEMAETEDDLPVVGKVPLSVDDNDGRFYSIFVSSERIWWNSYRVGSAELPSFLL